jgi:F0F1-type ATP synthase assembly protein I
MQRKLFFGLAIYVCITSLVFSLSSWTAGYSAFLGGGVAMLAVTLSAFLGLRLTAQPGLAAVNLIRSEVTKYLVSAIAMALIFKFVRPLEEVIFLCVLFVGFLVVPVIGYRHVLANQQSK